MREKHQRSGCSAVGSARDLGIHAEAIKTKYRGVAQLVARLLWEREAGVRATLLQNPGKLWDAKADGVLPLAGNWSKTGADPIFDHSWKTS